MKSCIVLIPVYKETPSSDDVFSIKISLLNLNGYPVSLIAPKSLNIEFYSKEFRLINVIRFPDEYFISPNSYSRLLMSEEFYVPIFCYDFMLILQTDAVVLKPELQYWVEMGYDYIGAPWKDGFTLPNELLAKFAKYKIIPTTAYIGNGGLSLRNIRQNLNLLREFSDVADFWRTTGSAEDLFFSFFGQLSNGFKLPNLITAAHFSHETNPVYMYELIGKKMPFAVHAWEKYDRSHWLNIFATSFGNFPLEPMA